MKFCSHVITTRVQIVNSTRSTISMIGIGCLPDMVKKSLAKTNFSKEKQEVSKVVGERT